MTAILAFDEAVAQSRHRGRARSVLLGNGFSIGFSNEFGYARLRDVVPMTDLSIAKNALFEHAGSDDFETVMQHLSGASKLLRLYNPSDVSIADTMDADRTVVQRALVEAITKVHPRSAWTIDDSKYGPAQVFLSHFSSIFTLNYDLLLYWTVLQDHLGHAVVRRDGFGRPAGSTALTWGPPSSSAQEIFYLHGAVHYYVRERRARKLELSNGNILDQLQTNLASGRYPLVVTEGSREDKEARIARSAYLTHCHEKLRHLKGDLFIHGMSMSPNDAHILEAIADQECRVRRIYVGLHGAPSGASSGVRARAEELRDERSANGGRPLKVRFYRSESARVWG